MADSNPDQLSIREGPCETDDSRFVRTQAVNTNSLPKMVGKAFQNDSVLPNGCVKHSLEDNGILKMIKNPDSCKCVDNDAICGISSGSTVNNVDGDESMQINCHGLEEREGSKTKSDRNSCQNESDDDTTRHCPSQSISENEICESLAKATISDNTSNSHEESESFEMKVGSKLLLKSKDVYCGLEYVVYESEHQMPDIMRLITKDLSEPYSIYTYRYFIHNWPKLCFLAMEGQKCVGAIVCKLDMHKKMVRRGYIAMLAVDQDWRRKGIGSHLVMKAIRAMVSDDCDEVVLETEITNKAALRLYENLGFVRDKRLFRYYLNGVDALRLKLWLR